MSAIHPNLQNLILAAEALAPLESDIVFVGGATAILYADDRDNSSPRATIDVDCIVEVASYLEYHKVEAKMRTIGFNHDVSEEAPICRWKKGPLIVDLMPTDEKILGFSNRWYQKGFSTSQKQQLPEGTSISVFTFPLFIATKLEALLSRGVKDLLTSQDLEDILFVMDSRKNFTADMRKASDDVLNFVRESFLKVSKMQDFEQAVNGNMPRGLVVERQNQILNMFTAI
ncbi:hypothetical protein GW915_08330 [bacterium]|nr:hypothetical protein [bacterium]